MEDMRKAVTINNAMKLAVIKALRTEYDVTTYMCAAREVDHPLTKLYRDGTVDAVMTVDSDLRVRGCEVIRALNWTTCTFEEYSIEHIVKIKKPTSFISLLQEHGVLRTLQLYA